ncbi:hypothetical protein HJG60_008645 [Phyllostomus discolor]|uniref:Uncharacterized protein n=1 Tax=Phyllostomus discolor TaxID=89673 RepID=A0A833Z1E6_9CHIR|nr:hypothetical protein HJG60_008645 [Phyllostomus discolor]
MGRAKREKVETDAPTGAAQVSGLERACLGTTREALNSAKQTERRETKPKACALLAQEERQHAKEVKHKQKGIQVNFLEELTLSETCLDVPGFKQPWAKWKWCWLPCLQCLPEIGSVGWAAPWKIRNGEASVNDPSAHQQITNLFKASRK